MLGCSMASVRAVFTRVVPSGGMGSEDAKRLKSQEAENNRLKHLLAEAHLDIEA